MGVGAGGVAGPSALEEGQNGTLQVLTLIPHAPLRCPKGQNGTLQCKKGPRSVWEQALPETGPWVRDDQESRQGQERDFPQRSTRVF